MHYYPDNDLRENTNIGEYKDVEMLIPVLFLCSNFLSALNVITCVSMTLSCVYLGLLCGNLHSFSPW